MRAAPNEFGQITQVAYGNSVTANYQYDVKGRLEYIQTTAPNGATTKTIQNAQYTFDAQDRIKRVQNDADDFQTDYQYAYDGINRLITANGSYVETDDGTGTAQTTPLKYKHRYGYADNGNLTRRDYVDPDTDALNERWNYTYVNHQARTVDSTVDGARFQMSYDLAGNMTGQIDLKINKEKQITLDSYDRIREVRDPTITEAIGQYWYDDRGFRIRKKAKHDKGGDFTDVETVYPSMYFGMELIGESNTLNSVSNIYHNGLRIAAVAQNGAKVWYLQDQVDSVKLVMGSAGQVLSRAEYLPYGETFVQKGDEDFAPKYNSQELDRETNYYFYNARYYDPQIARFTSADTIIDGETDSQGWNRYMYVHGNPIGAKDPTGHETVASDPTDRTGQARRVADAGERVRGVSDAVREFSIGALMSTPAAQLGLLARDIGECAGGNCAAAMERFTGTEGVKAIQQKMQRIVRDATGKNGARGEARFGAQVALEFASAVALQKAFPSNSTASVLKPTGIRFSQETVSFAKSRGCTTYTYDDIAQSMRKEGWQGGPINVVRMNDGLLTSVDNTRLRAANATGTDIVAKVHGFNDVLPADMIGRFRAKGTGKMAETWGEAVLTRIANQSKGFSKENPNGSSALPRLVGPR